MNRRTGETGGLLFSTVLLSSCLKILRGYDYEGRDGLTFLSKMMAECFYSVLLPRCHNVMKNLEWWQFDVLVM